MITDCAFTKGYSHQVCQDYCTDFSPHGINQLVLCDGCSSSKMVDVGARLLAHTVASHYEFDIEHLKVELKKACNLLRFNDYSFMDATLMSAKYIDGNIKVNIYGDGYIILSYKNYIEVFEITFIKGYPFYFSYLLDDNRLSSYDKLEDKNKSRSLLYIKDSFNDINAVVKIAGSMLNNENNKSYSFNIKAEGIDYIMFSSDGLNSFIKKNKTDTSVSNETIPLKEVLKKLITFKNFKGQFVQRRLNAFKKECSELGWDHYDDLSIAVMANT